MLGDRASSWVPLEIRGTADSFLRASGESEESLDPATGKVVARVSVSTVTDVDEAVERCSRAFSTTSWASDGARRSRVLRRFAAALERDSERLAELLTREQGKTIHEARAELRSTIDMVDFNACLARMVYGRSIGLGEAVLGVVLREPVGIVAVVTPWNWPLALLVRSLAPALAAGNSCVVKPASITSAVSVELLRLLASDPELPDGAMTCVLGAGETVGDALVGHAGVDMIAFTGDTVTGAEVMRRAATDVKKVALELGGKSPNIVFGDADLDKALAGAESAIFTSTGQICTAGSRLLVEDAITDEFVERLCAVTTGLAVGDGLDERTQLGPVASAAQRTRILDYVETGCREGRLIAGGAELDQPPLDAGFFVSPAIFGDLPAESALLREEIFGPVLTIQSFDNEAGAVALANDGDFGLAAGVWTQRLDRAWRVARALRVGTVWVNTYHHFYAETEVGGFKRSGIGRQAGVDGLHEFAETKHVNFDGSPTLW